MISPQSFTIADVGCDHAYVSIAIMQRAMAEKVIAMDVRTGPLDIAGKNVAQAGYLGEIDIRLGDGLERLNPGEADTIIIAGMGGLLMKGILERGLHIIMYEKKRPVLILQPQSDLREVRMFLYRYAYHIVCETMLEEDGKYYTVMKAEPVATDVNSAITEDGTYDMPEARMMVKEEPYTEVEWIYGRCNLQNKSDTLFVFLQKEQKMLQQIMDKVEASMCNYGDSRDAIPESTRKRLESVKQEIAMNECALKYY